MRLHQSVALFSSFLVVTLTGCAHAPKVVPIANADARTPHAYYTLPKASFTAETVGDLHSFTAGPLTGDLAKWLKDDKASCTYQRLMNPDDICYWRFKIKRRKPADALAACETDSSFKVAGQVSLELKQPLTVTASSVADETQQYAVDISPQLFEKTRIDLAFSPAGSITAFKAESTNLIAQTIESVAADVAAGFTLTSKQDGAQVRPASVAGKGLQELVNALARKKRERDVAASRPDSAAALAAIDEEIVRLRALAEGTDVTEPFKIKVDYVPSGRDSGNYAEAVGAEKALQDGWGCTDGFELYAALAIKPDESSAKIADAIGAKAFAADGLRYRVPVVAEAALRFTCRKAAADRNGLCAAASGKSVPFGAQLTVPQWGPTIALPRRMGWGAGAIDAKLDPSTAALLSLSTTSEKSFEAAVLNRVYDSYVARQAAAKKDTERANLERERAVLEDQVKICAARQALGQPPGDDCPHGP
ncbi:MAG TPA: hypothetical protein VN153_04915 [Tahibacter sp.]|nr:hypothetical protein [Tahibacter sp.]